MKIVIAPQTFKGSISALDVANAMSEGVKRTADAYRRTMLSGWRKSAVDLALKVGRTLPP